MNHTFVHRLSWVALLALAALTALPGTAHAAFTTPVFMSASGQSAHYMEAASTAGGATHAVWVLPDAVDDRIYHSVVTKAGAASAPQAISPSGQDASEPQVDVAPDGTAHVVWVYGSGNGARIQHVTISATGTVGTVQDVNVAQYSAMNVQVAVDGTGTAHVVWEQTDGSNWRVNYRAVAADGTLGALRLVSPAGVSGMAPRVATDTAGTAHVAFTSDGGLYVVKYVQVSAAGVVGAERTLTTPDAARLSSRLELAVTPAGIAHMVWRRLDPTGTSWHVYHATANANGASADTAVSPASMGLDHPQIAVAADGTAHVVWDRNGTTTQVVEHVSISAGGAIGTVRVLSDPAANSFLARVAVASSGTAHVAWRQNELSDFRVRHVAIPPGQAPGSTSILSGEGLGIEDPRIDVDGFGLPHVLWRVNDGQWRVQHARMLRDAPVCSAASATSEQGAAVQLTLTCSGEVDSRAVVTGPASGTLGTIEQASGTVTYTPAAGFSGTDSFTFAASNADATSTLATATITVTAKATPPPTPSPPPTPPKTTCKVTRLIGCATNDRLTGTKRADTMFGRAGNDTIFGLAGNDRLLGEAGNDRLVGGAGRDTLLGGPGIDTIDARDGTRDVIDCGPGIDRARVDRIDKRTGCERLLR